MLTVDIRRLNDEICEIKYPWDIIEHAYVDIEDYEHYIKTLEDEKIDTKEKIVGLILHAIQQGVSSKLFIHNYIVEAILMDQTSGAEADPDDIYRTNHPTYTYHRLKDIFDNKFHT